MRLWFLLFYIASLGICSNDSKADIDAIVDTIKAGLGEVPDIGPMIKLIDLFNAKIIRSDTNNFEIIQSGFREIIAQLSESRKRFRLPDEMKYYREADLDVEYLMDFMEVIFMKKTIDSTKNAIKLFLEKCEAKDPYGIYFRIHIKEILRTNLALDIYHSETKMNALKKRLCGIFNEVALMYIFQQYHTNGDEKKEDRKSLISMLEDKLVNIKNEINTVLDDLLKSEYLSKMDKMLDDVMNGDVKSELAVKAERISSSVFDIFTSDRLCLIVGKKRRYMPDVIVGPPGTSNGQQAYFNKKYVVVILRISKGNSAILNAVKHNFENFQKKNNECYSQDQTKLGQYASNNGVFILGTSGKDFGPDVVMRCNGDNLDAATTSRTCSYGNSFDGMRNKDVTYHLIPNQY